MAIHSSENEGPRNISELMDLIEKKLPERLKPIYRQASRAPALLQEETQAMRQKKFDSLPGHVKDFKGAWDRLSSAVQAVENASALTLSKKVSDLEEARKGMAKFMDDDFEKMLEEMELPGPVKYDV